MTENTSVAPHKKAHQAAHTGDVKTLTAMIADDVVWHSPGRNFISGYFHGREAVLAQFFGKMAELSGGTAGFEDMQNHTYFGSGDHSAAFFRWTAVRSGNSKAYPVCEVIRWQDGRIAEEWAFYDDQYAWDTLWSSPVFAQQAPGDLFMKRGNLFILILGSLALTILLAACGSAAGPASTVNAGPAEVSEVPRITAEELKKRLDDGQDILIIDTRIGRRQYALRHIPGAIKKPRSLDDVAHD